MKDLRRLALKAYRNSYSPYSMFKVGCAIKTSDNKYFYGCNVENISFGATICAERSAISGMISAIGNKSTIDHIYIISRNSISPCGICLQTINEFANDDTRVTLACPEGSGNPNTFHISEFIPKNRYPESLE